jgi:hypothetical protein
MDIAKGTPCLEGTYVKLMTGTYKDTVRNALKLSHDLISGFQRASLLSVTFINQLMHSILRVIDFKILLYKSLKDTH